MVENDVYICPPTPERVEYCSRTPPPSANARIRDFLKSNTTTTTATNENGENSNRVMSTNDVENAERSIETGDDSRPQEQRDGASSPPNCAICLGKISSKCFTDSCMHQFCFSCLLEWSKIKAECPLCKQAFKSIIHNVTSMDKYDEYKVQPFSNWITNHLEQYILTFPRYRVPHEYPQNNRIYQLFLQETPLTERFAREFASDNIPPRSSGSQWRAYVYQRHLYALPLLDFTGRSRDISARFYRENPAQIHRLMPWLNREIIWLLSSTVHYITTVLRTLEDLIMSYDMSSVSFRRRIQNYFHRYTAHFIHELTNFARSPYDFMGYDRNVQYRPYFEDEIQSIDSSDDSLMNHLNTDSDSSAIDFSENRISIQNRINNSSVIIFNAFGGNGAPSIAGETSRGLERTLDRIAALTNTSSRPMESVNIESDDSDECLFVGEQKPPHLRTPEMVELNSETDSDVMFVDENCSAPQNTVAQSSEHSSDSRADKRKAQKELEYTAKRKHKFERASSDESSSPTRICSNSSCCVNTESSTQTSSTVTSSSYSPESPSSSSRSESAKTRSPAHSSTTSASSGLVLSDSKSNSNDGKPNKDQVNVRETAGTTKRYARPKRRISKKYGGRKRTSKTIYDPSTSNSDEEYSDYNSMSSSSSSESSHEEFTVGKPSGSRKRSSRSRKASSHKKSRKTKKSSPKRKLKKLCIKREKNTSYRLVDSFLRTPNESSRSSFHTGHFSSDED